MFLLLHSLPPPTCTAAIFLVTETILPSSASVTRETDMEIFLFLRAIICLFTVPVLQLSDSEHGAEGHCLRHSTANHVFEVEVEVQLRP